MGMTSMRANQGDNALSLTASLKLDWVSAVVKSNNIFRTIKLLYRLLHIINKMRIDMFTYIWFAFILG